MEAFFFNYLVWSGVTLAWCDRACVFAEPLAFPMGLLGWAFVWRLTSVGLALFSFVFALGWLYFGFGLASVWV